MIAFIMMGQSNMSGRGALDELPPLEPATYLPGATDAGNRRASR